MRDKPDDMSRLMRRKEILIQRQLLKCWKLWKLQRCGKLLMRPLETLTPEKLS